ncbi:MAG: Mrp/NBP35 family ATP-binding protein [Bacteroidales bacterium]|jgi:ATP-binding protein involved in chromosome partitioning|nr:Mrp/NBP35 family ATP-binding protein [Bacteroidales bacterium]
MNITVDEVTGALKHVVHPAAGKDVVTLGMVQDIRIDGLTVAFTLVFAKAQDPVKNSIVGAAEKALCYYVHPEVTVQIRTLPESAAPKSVKKPMLQAKHIIAVASGKGGVGKSTIAVNLAVALSRMGYSVGLLDADIYGPSVPKMLGVEGVTPEAKTGQGEERIIPVECHGIKILSIGFFVPANDAVIWRGPMATSALKQLLYQAEWGNPDFLLIDLPPGTGDVHLTIVQELPLTGAVIVSTPQQVALADVVKGINMFRNEKVNVPVLGLVENMAWFTPAELPQSRYYLFGKEGGKQLAERENLPLLAQIPLVQSIGESGDSGRPVVANEDSTVAQAFMHLAENVVTAIEKLEIG